MKRQGLRTSVRELRKVADELEKEQKETEKELGASVGDRFQINIINKTPKCSDTWRIECDANQDLNVTEDEK